MAEALYTIDFTEAAKKLLANEFRDDETVAASRGLLTGVANLHTTFNIIQEEAENEYPVWSASLFLLGERVIYFQTGEVYECVVTSTIEEPTQSADWRKILNTFLGVDESRYYDGSRVQLEKALNKRFFLNFDITTAASDIYINTVLHTASPFLVGGTADGSSFVGFNTSEPNYIGGAASYEDQTCFIINYPAADYALLGSDAEQIVRNFVDQYVTAGMIYQIQTY